MAGELGKVIPVDVGEEMKRSYIDYAMSVIVARALPDVRDGLKPVHRRILYAMNETGNTPDKPYKKAARIVGDVLGRYHPHGDAAVYDAMVRLAQDFSSRYPLVDGHGNFGSLDGDPPAAMRYTEVRLTPLALEMLRDIDKRTVDFTPNFDDSLEEPVVLPARFPNLLVNGSAGIAVGMATNIPPHNLGEVIDGVLYLLDHPEADVRDLMRIIPGPDFPTGGTILGREGIEAAYGKGRGILRIRGQAEIESGSGGRNRIVITEIPFQVNKARLVERIAELVREKKLEGVSDLRDESDRQGIRVVIELKREAAPQVVLNRLYKFTPLQDTFGVILLALVGGEPRVLSLREMLFHYLEHQKEVVRRRTAFDLEKAEARAHILEGLKIALDHLDAVIALIRASKDPETARQGLMGTFGLSEPQAQAILDMRLQRLTGLEREKIEGEYREILQTIEYLRSVLANERLLLEIIRKELGEIRERFADPRRTRIVGAVQDDFSVLELIPDEEVVVTLTHFGYLKRQLLSGYRSQRRGGRGVTGAGTRAEDFLEHLFVANTHQELLFFTNRGRVYPLPVHRIPDASRQAKGTAVVNLLPLAAGEQVNAVIPVRERDWESDLILATARGVVKKIPLAEFRDIRISGVNAIGLAEGDEVIGVRSCRPGQEILLLSRRGQAVRFAEAEVRPMGRSARGVRGIRLREGDLLIGLEVIDGSREFLLTVTERGRGKRTPIRDYRRTARGGQGVRSFLLNERTGELVGGRLVGEEDEVMLITQNGLLIRTPAREISRQGRSTQGVNVMRLEEGDRVAGLALVAGGEAE